MFMDLSQFYKCFRFHPLSAFALYFYITVSGFKPVLHIVYTHSVARGFAVDVKPDTVIRIIQMKYVFFEMKSYPYGVGFRMPEGVVYQLTNNAVHDYFRVVAEAPVSQVGRKFYVDPLRRTQFFDKGGDCFFESEVIQNMGADIGRNIR